MIETEEDHFRRFAERYVISRADRFDDTEPRKDAWKAVNDARNIYDQIHSVARQHYRGSEQQAQQAQSPSGWVTRSGDGDGRYMPPYHEAAQRMLDPPPPRITDHIPRSDHHIHTSAWASRVKRAFRGKDPI